MKRDDGTGGFSDEHGVYGGITRSMISHVLAEDGGSNLDFGMEISRSHFFLEGLT
jgi:hypothetical protein